MTGIPDDVLERAVDAAENVLLGLSFAVTQKRQRECLWDAVTAALAEVEASITAERDDLAARIALVEALHTPVKVWQYDGTEGVFVFGQDDERVLMATLCSECTDPEVLGQIEDCEYQEGIGHEVEHPCPTIQALRGESE